MFELSPGVTTSARKIKMATSTLQSRIPVVNNVVSDEQLDGPKNVGFVRIIRYLSLSCQLLTFMLRVYAGQTSLRGEGSSTFDG